MVWFPRILFLLTMALAVGLAGTVLLAPWLEEIDLFDEPSVLLHLFAHDEVVRRTALASAAGLVVTALVFFRPAYLRALRKSRAANLPPGTFAGA